MFSFYASTCSFDEFDGKTNHTSQNFKDLKFWTKKLQGKGIILLPTLVIFYVH